MTNYSVSRNSCGFRIRCKFSLGTFSTGTRYQIFSLPFQRDSVSLSQPPGVVGLCMVLLLPVAVDRNAKSAPKAKDPILRKNNRAKITAQRP